MKAWEYLEENPASDAPVSDNPSGLYCRDCRATGASHCSEPEYCGGMRRMKPEPIGIVGYKDGIKTYL